ncbi:MAG: tetratricopeptide repeat protein [Myxococcales bacterium]|nr:tetratricopeptide repeat protein [Myxococcales bacterium]MDH5567680.1 tetratricopeptide repeat protein [Myxococcales bacterium]
MARRKALRPPAGRRRPARRVERAGALFAICLLAGCLMSGCGGGLESRMAEVRALQDVGQFTASIEALREILTVNPNHPEANYRLGFALVQTGEPSRAVWPLQKAAESPAYEIAAGVLLASTYFQTKNFDEAIRAATRVLEVDPERQAAMRIRASANLSARRLEDALRDTSRLVELYPEDYGVRALHATVLADIGRLDEAQREHDLLKKMGEASGDPAFRSRSCLAPATFAMDVLGDPDKARALYEDCAAQDPTDPVVLNHMMDFFDRIGAPERATELIRNAVEKAPENLALRHGLAMRLRNTGDPAAAEGVLRDAVETFGSAAAWSLMANFYRLQNEPEKALGAIETVARLSGGGGDRVRFTQADILIDLGLLDRAAEVADQLEQPVYAQLIRGRIQLMRGDPAGALASFEKGIRAWPNNASARFLAGTAARNIGDMDRAISEYREAVRANNAETDAALELARIYLQRGEPAQALAFANTALLGARALGKPDAYVVAARAAHGLGNDEQARRAIEALRQRGYAATATRELAILEGDLGGPARALEVMEASGLDPSDPANEDLLQQLAQTLSRLGRHTVALTRIDAALARSADRASLHELRGMVLLDAGQTESARAAFERAIALDENAATSIAALAGLAAEAGDRARAVTLLDRAYAIQPAEGGSYAYSAAQLLLASGEAGAAEARLREIVQRHPNLVGARNDLAWILAEKSEDLDLALALAEEAQRRDPSPQILDTLGWVHYKRGEFDEAVKNLEAAAEQSAGAASIRYRLGAALAAAGEPERARQALQRALAAGAFPEAEAARRELARLDRR